jgi:hypothetical protein
MDEVREDTTPVVLIDRTTKGGYEFFYNGRPYVFRPGRMKLTVGADVARHVFRHEHTKVWTNDGEFLYRLAVEDAPGFEDSKVSERLAWEMGQEILDQTPIELDATRAEGWDTRNADRGRVAIVPVNLPPADLRDRQGAAASISFAER